MTSAPLFPAAPQRHARRLAALVSALLVGGAAVLALGTGPAEAANSSLSQCNHVGPGPKGATTGMTCTVTIVNTIHGGQRSSRTTVTRQCSLDPCAPGNGTFTTTSANLVTSVNQCNNSDNDAGHPMRCTVSITNNISADTPNAQPMRAATINQCVGSGGGGGGTVSCTPNPKSVTGATITECNGSANGGGGTINCVVASGAAVSPALPITINQCNGSGNAGGSTVTCRVTLATHITAAVTPTSPSASPSSSASPRSVGGTGTGGTPPGTGTGTGTGGTPPQVVGTPTGGVSTGGGATAGVQHRVLLLAGGLLLLSAAGIHLRTRRAAR